MRAIDTNVLVRLLTRDDPGQFARAEAIVAAGDVFVPFTVMLETEWVLRKGYRFGRAEVVRALLGVAGLPGVTVEHSGRLAVALDAVEAGLDVADALHLASAEGCEAFLTFDRDLIRAAASLPGGPPVLDAGRAPA